MRFFTELLKRAAAMVAVVCIVSCSSSLTYNEALQRNVRKIEDTDKLDDARFLVEAASFNILAREMSELALESGYSATLVSFARENLEEHEELNRELRRLARREKIVLPGEMNEQHQKLFAELKSVDRRQFDRTYVRLLREAAGEDREEFSRMATEAESEDVRAFAARKLDLFDTHDSELETVDAGLLQTY